MKVCLNSKGSGLQSQWVKMEWLGLGKTWGKNARANVTELQHFKDWSKLVTWFATSDLSALFQCSLLTLCWNWSRTSTPGLINLELASPKTLPVFTWYFRVSLQSSRSWSRVRDFSGISRSSMSLSLSGWWKSTTWDMISFYFNWDTQNAIYIT